MQHAEVIADFRISRREAGLSHEDLAHLLQVTPSRISRLERGKSALTVPEICKLSLIFDKPIEELFRLSSRTIADHLSDLISTLPAAPSNWSDHLDNRDKTLERLTGTLSVDNPYAHES